LTPTAENTPAAPEPEPTAPDRATRRADEARLAKAAPRFELAALLRLLFARGYAWETLSFEGTRTLAERPGLVAGLRFDGTAPRRAIVRLNLGLLGPNGTLPSYFQRFVGELADPRPFLAFIRFFDDLLLRDRAWLTCPREGAAAGAALEAAYRAAAGFRSAPRLHWLFRAVVPELPVEVRAEVFRGERPGDGARFGPARLDGSAVMGPAYPVVARGFVVRLSAEDELDEAGRPWEEVLARRYRERIAPVLVRMNAPVQVRVAFERYRTGAALGPAAQMGTRRIRTKDAEAWEVVIAGPLR
jgi:hypothetical protein